MTTITSLSSRLSRERLRSVVTVWHVSQSSGGGREHVVNGDIIIKDVDGHDGVCGEAIVVDYGVRDAQFLSSVVC